VSAFHIEKKVQTLTAQLKICCLLFYLLWLVFISVITPCKAQHDALETTERKEKENRNDIRTFWFGKY